MGKRFFQGIGYYCNHLARSLIALYICIKVSIMHFNFYINISVVHLFNMLHCTYDHFS